MRTTKRNFRTGGHRGIIGSAAFLLVAGWVGSAHSAETQLEVLGKLTLQAQAEHRGPLTIEISGRLSDETGQPTAGVVRLLNQEKPETVSRACDDSPLLADGSVSVPPNGEFCFLTQSSDSHLSLTAEAAHFMPISQEIGTGKPGYLPPPRFTQVPQTIDLESKSPSVVEVLAGSGSYVRGVELTLRLNCPNSAIEIDKSALTGSRLERFEFTLPAGTSPGNCSLEATSTAPHHSPISQSRNVLVRAQVSLRQIKTEANDKIIIAVVEATTTGGRVHEGLIEARARGAFLVGAPIHNGIARLELERRSIDYDVELRFLPAGPSLVPAEAISVSVPAVKVGFRWATLHALLLLSFCGWLGYAWMRPRNVSPRTLVAPPPRKGIVCATGHETGPIRCKVVDAHTGDPIASALIALVEPGANSEKLIETQESDAQGVVNFTAALKDHRLLQLDARSENYMHLRSGVRTSELTVHLTDRRRAAVQNMVTWAKNQGKPWHRNPAPTPEDLAQTARLSANGAVERWAHQVSAVVYGKSEPSEATVLALKSPSVAVSTPGSASRQLPANDEPRG